MIFILEMINLESYNFFLQYVIRLKLLQLNTFFFLIYLAVLDLHCSMRASQFQHMGSNSLTRDQIWAVLHWEHGILPTGPPGKSLNSYFDGRTCAVFSCQNSSIKKIIIRATHYYIIIFQLLILLFFGDWKWYMFLFAPNSYTQHNFQHTAGAEQANVSFLSLLLWPCPCYTCVIT